MKNYGIGTIISDDDIAMKLQLKHSFVDLIHIGKMQACNWPKTKKGYKKKNNGRLPLHIVEPRFLTDPNHRTKVVGKVLYKLASLPLKYSKGDNALAQRIKEYWDTFLRQICGLNWNKN